MSSIGRSALANELARAAAGLPMLARAKTRYRPLVSPLHAILDAIPESARLYDIGCGNGALLALAARHRNTAVAHGHDVSETAVRHAAIVTADDPRIAVARRDAADGLPDLTSYDAVTLIDVLHHVPPALQENFLTDLARALAPRARLVLADIDAARPIGTAMNQLHDLVLSQEWVRPRRADWTAAWLMRCGLSVSRVERYRSLWYPHYLIVANK